MTTTRITRITRRTLHVVDADNLTGGPTEHQCVAHRTARHYRHAADVRDGDLVVGRVDRIVLGSGDGIFARPMADLRACGVHVEVVAPTGSVSHRLYRASDRVAQVGRPTPCTHSGCFLAVRRVSALELAA